LHFLLNLKKEKKNEWGPTKAQVTGADQRQAQRSGRKELVARRRPGALAHLLAFDPTADGTIDFDLKKNYSINPKKKCIKKLI
jgi:hypothetical protein